MAPKEKMPAIPPTPEAAVERSSETVPVPDRAPGVFEHEEAETPAGQLPIEPVIQPAPAAPSPQKDDVMLDVEEVLEDGMGMLFASLPEEAKPLFRRKGEEAASEISAMLRTARVKTGRVLRLIRDWLLTIPKVNRFFLEQEAKIKTDRILELHRELSEQPRTS